MVHFTPLVSRQGFLRPPNAMASITAAAVSARFLNRNVLSFSDGEHRATVTEKPTVPSLPPSLQLSSPLKLAMERSVRTIESSAADSPSPLSPSSLAFGFSSGAKRASRWRRKVSDQNHR